MSSRVSLIQPACQLSRHLRHLLTLVASNTTIRFLTIIVPPPPQQQQQQQPRQLRGMLLKHWPLPLLPME